MNKFFYELVIIDSGINEIINEDGISFSFNNSGVIKCSDFFADNVGHGTAIYSIIKSHNPNIKCFHIKIFDKETDSINEDVLLYALNYIYENIECKFINMSLGIFIPMKRDDLYDICNRLKEKGVILVSAFDNMEVISYPAAFDNVIGVASDSDCTKITDVVFINNPIVNVCGKGGLQRVKWIDPKYIFTQGNSYACAHITGILSKSSCSNMEDALLYLQNIAIKKYTRKDNVKPIPLPHISKGSKAVLFPFNKEMHSLVRFSHLLCVDIIDVYDVRQSARVNASTNKLLNITKPKDYFIKNIENINWDSFDIFVLGHSDELVKVLGSTELIEQIILQAYYNGKYIYCFDDISDIVKKHSLSLEQIYYPQIMVENIDHIPLGMLYRPWVPMLGVFGTTSKQGKFTLQLILREKFLQDGYCVGQIGTEPSAYLFDMDLCFHFGYHSTTNINRQNMVSYLNSEINNISQKGVDIIISGCQSGSVTYDFGNAKYYTFSQSEFLLGTLPDAVILCVNSYDETDYVRRTIQYIESCADSKVIALVVYPMGYNNQLGRSRLVHLPDTELNMISCELSGQFGVPVYILGKESDMEKLYATVIAFFTSDTEVKS